MVRLRAHHLICLHFYRGAGYNPVFVENLTRVLKEAEESGVMLVDGGDDVCRACPSFSENICTNQPGGEAKIQMLDTLASRLLKPKNPDLSWSEIKEQIPTVIGEWKKQACENCEWKVVCENDESWNTI
ncbi:MAG: DUF1284 domain-containing protein [Candidatus Hydrothermarchaeales archaeon]